MRAAKAQIWYTDFMIGVLIFSIVIITYFYYASHTEYSDETLISSLLSEAKTISNSLVTQGYPLNWTAANVTTVGITNGDFRINTTKLSFYLEYMNSTRFNELCTDPGSGCVAWNTSYHLAQNTRLLIYDGSIVRVVLNIYQTP
jgi:hypothetical protein